MSQWVSLKDNLLVRPTQNGLELLTPGVNVTIELPKRKKIQNKLLSILFGEREIFQLNKEDEFHEVLLKLASQGLLQFTDRPPISKRNEILIEDKLWKLRKNVVGFKGPIVTIYWVDPENSKFQSKQLHFFTAKFKEKKGENWATGSGKTPEEAELKAIMEALERWTSGIIPKEKLIRTSMRKMRKAIDPRKVISYSKRQYKTNISITPFDENREYYWQEVISYPKCIKKYLPIECLYYPTDYTFLPQRYTFANSSGVAAGFGFEQTLLRALYETIERDAFMIVWLNRLIMPQIKKQSLPLKIQEEIKEIQEAGYEIYLVDLTLDLIPVILAVAVSKMKKPALQIGAAANLNSYLAIQKALNELKQILYWSFLEGFRFPAITDPRKVETHIDHMALFAQPTNLEKAEFLWQGKSSSLLNSPLIFKNELEILIELLTSRKIELIVADLSLPVLKEKYNVWTIRALPLGLIPISFGYRTEPLGMSRIQTLPLQLNLRPNPWPKNQPFPHPFA